MAGLFIYTQSDDRQPETASVVLITSSGCRSAETRTVGTIIEGGFVLTVAHGVAGQTSNRVTTSAGDNFQATIVAIDIEQDLALLAIDSAPQSQNFVPVELAPAKAGELVSFVAFDDQQQFTRDAKIKRRLRINTQDIYLGNMVARPGLEVELEVSVGNSGGPLINNSGQLVGIVWSTSRVVKNRSWGTRSEAVATLLTSALANPSLASSKPVACTG